MAAGEVNLSKYSGKVKEVESSDIDVPKDLEEMDNLQVIEFGIAGGAFNPLVVKNALSASKVAKETPQEKDPAEISESVTERDPRSMLLNRAQGHSNAPNNVTQPTVPIRFSGRFGALTVRYKNIYVDDIYIILVSSLSDETQYQPPVSDEPFIAQYEGALYNVLSPGIAFDLTHENINITVLLIEQE
jgi:hypothetical protein